MKIDEKNKQFKNEVKFWSKKLKVFPMDVKIQKMKHWGCCCSKTGELYFNSDLLFQRKELKTYVIVHELLHLKIPNHSKLFKAMLSLHLPDWKKLDKELNFTEDTSELSP